MSATWLSWVEISESALNHNISEFKKLVGEDRLFSCAVKANAYGHGLVEVARIVTAAGVQFLDVNSLWEALRLRENGITAPILVLGYTNQANLEEAFRYPDLHLTVYHPDTITQLGELTNKYQQDLAVHLKVETGLHRQGIDPADFPAFISHLQRFPHLKIAGLYSHFANIEDSTERDYADYQLQQYTWYIDYLKEQGITVPLKHIGNTAATMLYPETYFDMIRFGIGTYGLWPSMETKLSVFINHRRELNLHPVLTWKTLVAQVKEVPAGALVGYGCTYKTTTAGRVAILPVGYYDGYDRGLSNQGYVLIRGQRAPIRGRICMNMTIVDVSHLPDIHPEEEVVLLGRQGSDQISAETLAGMLGTINYEVVTRIHESIPRHIIA